MIGRGVSRALSRSGFIVLPPKLELLLVQKINQADFDGLQELGPGPLEDVPTLGAPGLDSETWESTSLCGHATRRFRFAPLGDRVQESLRVVYIGKPSAETVLVQGIARAS